MTGARDLHRPPDGTVCVTDDSDAIHSTHPTAASVDKQRNREINTVTERIGKCDE